MKPLFLDCPPRYTRAQRTAVHVVDDASHCTRPPVHRHDKIVLFGSVSAAAALVIVLFIWG